METCKALEKQADISMVSVELVCAPGDPFNQRLNELLDREKFDEFVEGLCQKFTWASLVFVPDGLFYTASGCQSALPKLKPPAA
jgi:hypothetical protein